jgi:hypothetical protein
VIKTPEEGQVVMWVFGKVLEAGADLGESAVARYRRLRDESKIKGLTESLDAILDDHFESWDRERAAAESESAHSETSPAPRAEEVATPDVERTPKEAAIEPTSPQPHTPSHDDSKAPAKPPAQVSDAELTARLATVDSPEEKYAIVKDALARDKAALAAIDSMSDSARAASVELRNEISERYLRRLDQAKALLTPDTGTDDAVMHIGVDRIAGDDSSGTHIGDSDRIIGIGVDPIRGDDEIHAATTRDPLDDPGAQAFIVRDADTGRKVDVRDLSYVDGAWRGPDSKPVSDNVAQHANDHRRVELHQHIKGVLSHDDLAKLMFPGAEDPTKATVEWLRDMYMKDADGLRSGDEGRASRDPEILDGRGPLQRILDDPDLTDSERLERLTKTSEVVPFDATYDPRGLMIDVLTGRVDRETGEEIGKGRPDPDKGEAFLRETLRRLRADGEDYVEAQGKWEMFGVTRERFQRVAEEEGVTLRFLRHRVSEREFANDGLPTKNEEGDRFASHEEYQAHLREELGAAGATRDEQIGLDVCGPEGKPFTDAGMDNMESMFTAVRDVALDRGTRMVFRPHVGEGYAESIRPRAEGVDPKKRSTVLDPTSPADIAHHNLEMAISRVEKMRDDGVYTSGGAVQIRFGHVTHISPEQARRMQALGIIAEVQLGSNLLTGASPRASDNSSQLDQHPLLNLMAAGVDTTLSTDGHGAMKTSLDREYRLAERMLRRFRQGQIAVDDGFTTWTYEEMVKHYGKAYVEKRFSIDRLHDSAQTYRAQIDAPL